MYKQHQHLTLVHTAFVIDVVCHDVCRICDILKKNESDLRKGLANVNPLHLHLPHTNKHGKSISKMQYEQIISKKDRHDLAARVKRGDYRRASILYKDMTGMTVSYQYLEHFCLDRREVTGLSGRHSPIDMYNAIYIAVSAREVQERAAAKLVAAYRQQAASIIADCR